MIEGQPDVESARLIGMKGESSLNAGLSKIGHARTLASCCLLTVCIIYGIVAVLTIDPRARGEYSGTADKVDISWANMRWKTSGNEEDSCPPRFRLANATIHCGIGGMSPINVSSDGTRYCGGVLMQPNYCTLPTAGGWASQAQSASGVNVALPRPLPHRLGIHRRNIDLPRCKTIEDFVDGAYAGVDFDQEWVPKSCSAVPLSPFVWTENTKCQATITMIVSIMVGYLF